MTAFYRVRPDAPTVIEDCRELHAPGYSLNIDDPPAQPPDGWTVAESRQAFLTTDQGGTYRSALAAEVMAEALERSENPNLDDLAAPGEGEPWVPPLSVVGAYRLDARVTHNGSTWTSVRDWNTWEPGTPDSGWVREIPDAPDELPWEVGLVVVVDQVLTHDGHRWRAKVAHTAHTGWEPSPWTHAVWEDLGPI